MKITNAEFITSIAALPKYKEASSRYSCPEICVVGRSNVGKSTFINCVTGRKKLAKASVTPGRTRLINLFDLNRGTLVLADLPGYGYAAAPKTERKGWAQLIEEYLGSSEKLKRVFALVDLRHEPTVLDKQMLKYLYAYNIPFTVVATKADKLSKSQISAAVQTVSTALTVGRDDIIVFSGLNGTGKEAVEAVLDSVLEI
ncbi:ribosome biogenesis GTP-binding protein YihA/YsxC [Pumilibacter muris]|uniref:ribosome biogenesis GTP-binding protein YihA/YsxC n=1 Tax=Pumilibacter muris TaxID=2941510 RepID=UPI00203C3F4C|nr:ribosome biogenesis GTP-binding protein YihA/YsxC [Pumilibacter muris]